jgi:methyltransferase
MLMLFSIILTMIIVQRMVELAIAKRNELKMIKLGGYEVGGSHYKIVVTLHTFFFLSLIVEVIFFQGAPLFGWWLLLTLFLFLQLMRVWTIRSLGMFWNTKIIILPGASPVIKGPYRWIKHPNYLIVILELMVIPLMFQAYFTALLFTIFNLIILLKIRIPLEEQALNEVTSYNEHLGTKNKFIR